MCDLRRQRLEACLLSGRFYWGITVHVNQFLIRADNRFQASALRRRGPHVRIVMALVRPFVRRTGRFFFIKAMNILLRVLEDARNAKARKSSRRRIGKRFTLSVACQTDNALFWQAPETKK